MCDWFLECSILRKLKIQKSGARCIYELKAGLANSRDVLENKKGGTMTTQKAHWQAGNATIAFGECGCAHYSHVSITPWKHFDVFCHREMKTRFDFKILDCKDVYM